MWTHLSYQLTLLCLSIDYFMLNYHLIDSCNGELGDGSIDVERIFVIIVQQVYTLRHQVYK